VGRRARRRRLGTTDILAGSPAPRAALEGDRLGANAERRAFLSRAAVFPLLVVKLAIDEDSRSLLQAVGAVLGLSAPDLDIEIVGLVGPAALAVGRRVLKATRSSAGSAPLLVARSSTSRVRFRDPVTRMMSRTPSPLLSSAAIWYKLAAVLDATGLAPTCAIDYEHMSAAPLLIVLLVSESSKHKRKRRNGEPPVPRRRTAHRRGPASGGPSGDRLPR
jgi:hypothetical protein